MSASLPFLCKDLLPSWCQHWSSALCLTACAPAACEETKNKDEVVWVSRCSSRIWRRSNAKDAWSKVANGEGAWRPKKRKGTAGRPSRKKSAKLEDGGCQTWLAFLSSAVLTTSFFCHLHVYTFLQGCFNMYSPSSAALSEYHHRAHSLAMLMVKTTLTAVQCQVLHATGSLLRTTPVHHIRAV